MTDILSHMAKTYEKSPNKEQINKNNPDKSKLNQSKRFQSQRQSVDNAQIIFTKKNQNQDEEMTNNCSPPHKMIKNVNDNRQTLKVHRSIAQNLFKDFKMTQKRDSILHVKNERSISNTKFAERQASIDQCRDSITSLKNLLKDKSKNLTTTQSIQQTNQDIPQTHTIEENEQTIQSLNNSQLMRKSQSYNRFSKADYSSRRKDIKTSQNSLNTSLVKQSSNQSKSSIQKFQQQLQPERAKYIQHQSSSQKQNGIQHQVKEVKQIDSSQLGANHSLSQVRSRTSLIEEKMTSFQSTNILNEMRNSPIYKYQRRMASLVNSPSRNNKSHSTSNSLIRLHNTNQSLTGTKVDLNRSTMLNQDLKILEPSFNKISGEQNQNTNSAQKKRQPVLNQRSIDKQEKKFTKLMQAKRVADHNNAQNFEIIQEKNEDELKQIQIDPENFNTESRVQRTSEGTPKAVINNNVQNNASWIKTQLMKEKEKLYKNITQISQIKPVKKQK